MSALNTIGCPEMVLLVIPVILFGVWYNWKEKRKEERVKKQNRNRERDSNTTRRGAEPLSRKSVPVRKKEQVQPVVTPTIPTAGIRNIASDTTDTSWFLCTHKDLPAPSTAESIIIEQLNMYNIIWHREVSFRGLQFTPYSWPRYDFYIPALNIVIEYDGQLSHSNDIQIATDKAKDKFCNDNGITIIRYNRKHYYNMYGHINTLMKSKGIKKKNLQM